MFVHVKPAGGSLEQMFYHWFLVLHAYHRAMQFVFSPYGSGPQPWGRDQVRGGDSCGIGF